MLGEILPVYCKVLMDPQYEDYLAELSIDGYTDTSGDYVYNLELSQARALAVASYLFSGCRQLPDRRRAHKPQGKADLQRSLHEQSRL